MDKVGLCFRCEHRARFFETELAPRFECGQINCAVHGCYMYQPVKPVVVAPNEGDDRPLFSGIMISGRCHFVRISDGKLTLKRYEDGSVLYWDLQE